MKIIHHRLSMCVVYLCPQAIYEKIVSLDLQQVHAKIKQVDSHATLGNGIVIQVGNRFNLLQRELYLLRCR